MRTIDADALKTLKFQDPISGHGYDTAYRVGFNDAIDDVIEYAPTIDAVEVVRCKDCRWYKKWKTIGRDDGYCGYARMTRDGLQYINTNDNNFCSYGERKSDE